MRPEADTTLAILLWYRNTYKYSHTIYVVIKIQNSVKNHDRISASYIKTIRNKIMVRSSTCSTCVHIHHGSVEWTSTSRIKSLFDGWHV